MPYDTILRSSRSNDLKQHDPAPANERDRGTVSDRLAELARVVAQSHPIRQSDASVMDGREYTAATPRAAPDWRRSPPSSNVMRDTPPVSEKLASADHLPQYDERGLAAPAHEGYEHDRYDDDGTSTGPQDMETSDHPRRAGRRCGGVLTALTLVGCVILAVGAAYSFRNYYAGSAPSAGPDIVADKTPNVAGPSIDPQAAGKVIQHPVGAQGWDVEPNLPLGWLTPSPLSSTAPPAARPSGSGAAAPSSTTSNEPKRVRTLTIRPDANDPSGRPIDVTSSARVPDAAATLKGTRDLPRSLDPQQLDKAPFAPPTTGGYVVQVSAQRSEAQAQASFRLMQAKYPSGFSGRSPIIKRSDLGAKGVFYRALVGPFASAGDAGQFCSNLKAAGGQCIVQKN